jgi:signal transduction histidine kinase/CheY-like chemotaxis protein
MWHLNRLYARNPITSLSIVDDLTFSATRNLMITAGLFFPTSVLIIGGEASTFVINVLFAVVGILLLLLFIAYRLMANYYLASQLLWQIGLLAAIVTGIWATQAPEIALLCGVIPLISVMTLGIPGALLSGLGVIVISIWLGNTALFPDLSPVMSWMIVAMAVFSGLVGWAATNPLLTAAEWSLFGMEEARKHLNDAREQRVELLQIQEDLVQANRELARLSDRLKVLQQVADEARQAKAEFVANVSHELRTPLNMIIGFSDVIIQNPQMYGGRLPAALLTDITAIRRNTEHLSNLVNDVLDLSQVESGRMALSKEWVSIPEIIDSALSVVKGLFGSKGLYIKTNISPAIPLVHCDPVRIRQVIINLLSNAGRFTDQGGVEITCQPTQNTITIGVRDTGPGIAENDQKKIFEPFQQVDNSIRRKHDGSGLGLTISKQFVEMHGGHMWLESQLDIGTLIGFDLPLETRIEEAPIRYPTYQRAYIPEDEVGYRLRSRPFKAPALDVPPRYIIVENGNTLANLLNRYLPDVEITLVRDPQQGITELSRSPAQLVILNTSSDEFDTIQSKLPYNTPVVRCFVPGESEAARQLGVMDYLVKPVSITKLQNTIQKLSSDKAKTILVVDDEPDVLHLYVRMLESMPTRHRILQATDGVRALDMIRKRKPDIVMMDLVMPNMDGFQVLAEKSHDPTISDIPVIVISARDPMGEPILGNTLSICQNGGFSVANLMDCLQVLSNVLSPLAKTGE